MCRARSRYGGSYREQAGKVGTPRCIAGHFSDGGRLLSCNRFYGRWLSVGPSSGAYDCRGASIADSASRPICPEWRALKGLALRNIAASLRVEGKIVRQEFGEMEFTPYVAGPIVLRMSRSAVDALIDGRRVDIVLDLKPALSEKQLENRLVREWNALGRSADRKSLLRKLLPAQLLPVFESRLPIRSGQKFSCDEQERSRIIRLLKEFVLPIDDYRPFEEAIVTAGEFRQTRSIPVRCSPDESKGCTLREK